VKAGINTLVLVIAFLPMASWCGAQTLSGTSNSNDEPAIKGENTVGGVGVFGRSKDFQGVHGESENQAGTVGISKNFVGVWGESSSDGHPGVIGLSKKWQGVHGESENQAGTVGISKNFVGVWAETSTKNHPGIFAKGPTVAGRFEGNVEVTGDVLVRGQKIGATGPQGPQGPPGPAGPRGPANSVAICAEGPVGGTASCSCHGRLISNQAGACSVTSDTGGCSAATNGCCAVCAP
jgi:hypothetical protein